MGHLGHKIKLIDRQFRSRMDKNLDESWHYNGTDECIMLYGTSH